MSQDHTGPNAPLPFPHAGVPVVGQPFTIASMYCPINATLTCNCGGADTTLTIVGSVAVQCPSCQKSYNAAFNPITAKIEIKIVAPTEQVPS